MDKLLFTGDFFCSETDTFDFSLLDQELQALNVSLILNVEGSFSSSVNDIDKWQNIKLAQSQAIFRTLTNSIYYSIYNNHSTDFGKNGLDELMHAIKKSNTHFNEFSNVCGFYKKEFKVIFFGDLKENVSCKKLKLDEFNKSSIMKREKYIKEAIVIIHGGLEYRVDPSPYQRYLSHLLIKLGAKAVIFHHSHVEGKYEVVDGKIIHYGLGNFFFSSVKGIHGHDHDTRLMLSIDLLSKWKFYTLSKNYEVSEINREPTLYPELDGYSKWYKKIYKIDSGLRPRQLYYSDFIISFQFFVWKIIAVPLVKIGISKYIKKVVKIVIQ